MATSTQNPDGTYTLAAPPATATPTTSLPQAPATTSTPPVQPPTSPAPTVNVNVGQPSTQPQTTQNGTEPSQGNQPMVPTTSLQPGAQGADVANLQNYLVQMGYLTPDQVASGPGNYGPQTTAAVAKMQSELGIQAGSGAGYYGPQTKSALTQKYNGLFDSMQGTQAPDSNPRLDIQNATQDSSNPVLGAMTSSLGPIMQSLTQVLKNINDPALTAVSLQQEYSDFAKQNNLPGLQSQMLNMQNIMNGTEQDIRDEVSKAGGTATESQIQGMTSSRNKVILKQYNSLATQYQAAQTNIGNMMQYASQDQQTELQRQQATASVTESMASIETQALQMGMTMQNNARQAVQYNVTQMGYKGLAEGAAGNPQMLNYYENILGLAPGTLSNPTAVAGMDTYKDQQLQLNNYKAAIAAYTAGYGGGYGGAGGAGGGAPSSGPGSGQVGVTPVDTSSLTRPSWLKPDVPLTLTAGQMEQYTTSQKAAHVDPGTNNVVAPGIGYYMQQSDGSYVLKAALPSPVDSQYNSVKQTMNNAGVFEGSPTVTRKWTLSANSAISSFKDSGTYKVASNVAPYLAAIHAAADNPGDKSVSDFELLDSFVKASKGGAGQVTDSQVNVMLNGASIPDKWNIMEQKLQNGGVLSPDQRTALISLADSTYKENLTDFRKGYVQATQAMQAQGIPAQFWRNLPDFSDVTTQYFQ